MTFEELISNQNIKKDDSGKETFRKHTSTAQHVLVVLKNVIIVLKIVANGN
jgi:hypothetical protein